MSTNEAYSLLHDLIVPGFIYFLDHYGQEFLSKSGLTEIRWGSKIEARDSEEVKKEKFQKTQEEIKEAVGSLLNHHAIVLDMVRGDPQFAIAHQVTHVKAGEYLTAPEKMKDLFASFAPTASDPQPIIHDRRELEKRCRGKEQFVQSGKAKGPSDPLRQRAELIDLANNILEFKKGVPVGTGTLNPQSHRFEFAFFLQVLAYLAVNLHNLNRAASTGHIPHDMEGALLASAKHFGFSPDTTKILPHLGLLLIKGKYEPNPVINFRVENVENRTVFLKWEFPHDRCDKIILERKNLTSRQEVPDILLNGVRRVEHSDDLKNRPGEEFEYRVRSIWNLEAAKDAPRRTAWIPDEPRIISLKMGEGGIILEWEPGRNCLKTLIFRRTGSNPKVAHGQVGDSGTKQVAVLTVDKKTHTDKSEILEGTTYYYLLVAEYPGAVYSGGVTGHITTPKRPDAPRRVEATYHFDPESGGSKVTLEILPGVDALGASYEVRRYQSLNRKKVPGTGKVVQASMQELTFVDQYQKDKPSDSVEPGISYIYQAIPRRQGLEGKGTDSDSVPIVPGVWNLQPTRGDGRIEIRYQCHPSVTEVVVRRNGTTIPARRDYVSDTGLTNGHTYTYLIACRYKFKDGTDYWSKGQEKRLKPRVPPQPVALNPKAKGEEIIFNLENPRAGSLRVFRFKDPPQGYRFGDSVQLSQIAQLEKTGKEVVVDQTKNVAIDNRPSPHEPYYLVFTIDKEEDLALTGQCRKYVYVPDVDKLTAFLVEGGVRLRWTWPSGCDQALVLFQQGSPPGDPEPSSNGKDITWTLSGQPLSPLKKADYVEDGNSHFLEIAPTAGPWCIAVRTVVGDAIAPGTNRGATYMVTRQSRIRMDYLVYREGNQLMLEWRAEPPDAQFLFKVKGSTIDVPADINTGSTIFPVDGSSGAWPEPDATGIRRWQRPWQFNGQKLYARLFLEERAGEAAPLNTLIAVRHPKGVLSPLSPKGNRNIPPERSSFFLNKFPLLPPRRILCPYCFERFGWWQLLYSDIDGKKPEAPLLWWGKRFLYSSILYRKGAPESLITITGIKKLCSRYCRQVRKESKKAVDLDNSLFRYPSIHIALCGTPMVGKSHWIFSITRRKPLGFLPVDSHTQEMEMDNLDKVINQRTRLPRTMPPADGIVPPLLYDTRYEGGDKRIVLALCDVDGESWGKFGKAGYMRYLQAAHGYVLILDPLQMPRFRQSLGKDLPKDAPGEGELGLQDTAINNLLDALKQRNLPKYKTPIAVVISKGDVMRADPLLRAALWDYPIYQETASHPVYDLSLHWTVQFAVRNFLQRYEKDIVRSIEDNFDNFAYFCVAPTGNSAQIEGKNWRFNQFSPWRVEEPLLWLFYQLGLIPGI
jgi:hypothetical protein